MSDFSLQLGPRARWEAVVERLRQRPHLACWEGSFTEELASAGR